MEKSTKLAVVRGKFLNAYEMQIFEPLAKEYDITAFGSLTSYHSVFDFPTVQLICPMDLPDFPYKMPLLNRLFTDAHYLYGLEEKLKGFDIVHSAETYYHYTQQAINARKKGYVKKVIATVLENIPFNNEGIWGRKEFKKRAREELDHIIALTQKTKNALLAEGADEKKISIVSHGINTTRFTPKKNWLQNEKKKKFTVLFSGRLEFYKGVYDLLSAIVLLKQDETLKEYSLRFTIVGEGSEKSNMLGLEKRMGIAGEVFHTSASYSEMPYVYQNADIFWAPSKPTPTYEEQYCTALLEAQAAGLPIITTKTGGIPENIGNAGVLVDPGNFYRLKEAVKEFVLSPKKRIEYAKRARERAEKVHDAKLIAKKLSQVYEKVLNS